jgi:uncharacterized protein YbcI
MDEKEISQWITIHKDYILGRREIKVEKHLIKSDLIVW